MTTPGNLYRTSKAISASSQQEARSRELTFIACHNATPQHERRLMYYRWQGYVIRGIYEVSRIIVETCIDHVSVGIKARDFGFYQKCENDANVVDHVLRAMMSARWKPSDFLHDIAELDSSYGPWVKMFLDKMKSLNTKSSLMAATRVKHALEHYSKNLWEYHEWAETSYVDADPTRTVTALYVPIALTLEELREGLRQHALPRKDDVQDWVLGCLSSPVTRKSSPSPTIVQKSLSSQMDMSVTPGRSFADVVSGRQSSNLGARSAWPPSRNF